MKKYLLALGIAIVLALTAWGATYFQDKTKLVASVDYACNEGKTIHADLYTGESRPAESPDKPPIPGGKADVALSDGRTLALNQTISADGARFANSDESFVFWAKGNGALVLENNSDKTYIGCTRVAPLTADNSNLQAVFADSSYGMTIRLPGITATSTKDDPQSYKVEPYLNQSFGPSREIHGIRFVVPEAYASGTNLGADSFIGVEEIPQAKECSAALFLPDARAISVSDSGEDYSVATSTGAGAGNRYEEIVFAIPGTNPCVAVHYFVHSSVLENYPEGTVQGFNREALLGEFDAIRRTLVVNQ